MRRAVFVFGCLIVLATAGASFADADATTCKRVQKMLEMGRTTEDIVSTSAGTITEEDVERCKAEKAQGGDGGGEEKKAE
ncbi:MAG TPA: hypothetical protein VNO26_11700 [Candidatus Limnocylindria bacterium]|nr:hypothetical protein [Candidatus Limnocylindria bacterium]